MRRIKGLWEIKIGGQWVDTGLSDVHEAFLALAYVLAITGAV